MTTPSNHLVSIPMILIYGMISMSALRGQESSHEFHQPMIQDIARVFHPEEIAAFQKKIDQIMAEHQVPIEIKTISSKQDFQIASKNWEQKKLTPNSASPLSLIAIIHHANQPEVRIKSKVFDTQIEAQSIQAPLQLIESTASGVNSTKTSLQITLQLLSDELPFLIKRTKAIQEKKKHHENQVKQSKNNKIKYLLGALSLGLLTLVSLFLLFLKFQRNKPVYFVQPSWKTRLGAPFSGGNNIISPEKPQNIQALRKS